MFEVEVEPGSASWVAAAANNLPIERTASASATATAVLATGSGSGKSGSAARRAPQAAAAHHYRYCKWQRSRA